jgi:hypothetical protein
MSCVQAADCSLILQRDLAFDTRLRFRFERHKAGGAHVAAGHQTPDPPRLDLPAPGEVAQLVEHTAENRGVAGSIPALATSSGIVASEADH